MLVKDWMSKDIITVKTNDSVVKAQTLLLDRNIGRLPVMEEGKLAGIITDRDIRKVLIPSETLRVKNLMTHNPVTVPWNYTIGETAEIFRIYGLERKNLRTLKKMIFEKAAVLYMVDHRENIREFYNGKAHHPVLQCL